MLTLDRDPAPSGTLRPALPRCLQPLEADRGLCMNAEFSLASRCVPGLPFERDCMFFADIFF